MTRDQLISELLRQVRDVTDEIDETLRRNLEWRLRVTSTPVLREIYSTNSVRIAVERAKSQLQLSPVPISLIMRDGGNPRR